MELLWLMIRMIPFSFEWLYDPQNQPVDFAGDSLPDLWWVIDVGGHSTDLRSPVLQVVHN